jgi:very-short-patch-repair endonuclease
VLVMRPRRFDMRGGKLMKLRARQLCGNLTDAERVLWRELRQHQLGARFRRQFPIPPYIVDFACLEAKLIVEADGGQHATSRYDESRDARLTAKGWRILRLWNNDILSNRAGVLQIIAEALGTYPYPNPPPLAGEGVSIQLAPLSPVEIATSANLSSPPPAGEGRGRG